MIRKFLLAIIFSIIATSLFVACSDNAEDVANDGNKYVDYKIAPIITVDYADYSSGSLPFAVKDKAYKIFGASAQDIYGRNLDVNVSVYAYYYCENRIIIDVTGGCFVPENYGVYTIVYSATDEFGNNAAENVDVRCVEKQPLNAVLTDKTENGVVGSPVKIADVDFLNYCGNVEYSVNVVYENNGAVYDLADDGTFFPNRAGNYNIIYSFNDYSEKGESSYKVNVSDCGTPIIGKIVMPSYFIAGVSYSLPMPSDCFYSESGDLFAIVPSIEIKYESDGTTTTIDKSFVPEKADDVTFTYTARFSDKVSTVDFKAKIIDTGIYDVLNPSAYFYGDDVGVNADSRGISVTTVTEGATVDFINPVISGNVSFTFGIDEYYNGFNALEIILIDAYDNDTQIKLKYYKFGTKGKAVIVDDAGEEYDVAFLTEGFYEQIMTEFVYDNFNKTVTLGDSSELSVTHTADGRPFNGFSSAKVWLSFRFCDVSAKSGVCIFSVDGQVFNNKINYDEEIPYVYYKPFKGTLNVGDVCSLERVFVGDVLDPATTVSYAIKDPEGNFVEDINGITISTGYDYNNPHAFNVTKIGKYLVNLSVSDSIGNSYFYSYAITVNGKDSTVLVFTDDTEKSIKAGDSITLKTITVLCNENVSYDVYVYVYCPDLLIDYVGKNEDGNNGAVYTPDVLGTYYVYYYVYDSQGYVNMAKYSFTVK